MYVSVANKISLFEHVEGDSNGHLQVYNKGAFELYYANKKKDNLGDNIFL